MPENVRVRIDKLVKAFATYTTPPETEQQKRDREQRERVATPTPQTIYTRTPQR